jgi:DNA excision repair protein ERCC-2
MSEIEKALAELKALMKYRSEQLGYEEEFRAVGLSSRKNLCLHPSVKREKSGAVVDARCRSLTAGFVKEKKERGEDVELCVYHDVFNPTGPRPYPQERKENGTRRREKTSSPAL